MFEIFEQEKIDGLASSLANTSIAYSLDIKLLSDEILADTKKWVATAGLEQPDLFYMDSILATVGWNLNDDIFLKDEVLAAKNTPVDKPFNMMHNQDDIIGHMTAARLLNSDYQLASDEDFEHIAVSSVIYKAWRDEEKKKEIDQTVAEILDGKWKVSMECLFSKFDYGLITPEGKQIIIARTPESSYLTKYLRAYKGPGTIQNNKIGRVLRNITFCGKGLVDNPGNPYSIIFNKSKKFFGANASLKELRMNELELTQAKLKEAEAELLSVKSEIQKAAEAKLTAAIAERDTVIKAKEEAIAGLQADLTKLSATLSEAKASLEATEAIKAEAVKGFQEAKAELEKIKAETVLASRKAALAKVVDADRAESLLVKFASASQEMFDELITTLSAFVPFKKKDEEEKKEDDTECAKKACAETIVADLAKAELDTDVAGHVAVASQTDNSLASIVGFLTQTSGNKSLYKGEK